jgi:hypothetical protein
VLNALPIVAGPTLLFYAVEQGAAFAAAAAQGTLMALVSVGSYALVYAHASRRMAWPAALVRAITAWTAITMAFYAHPIPALPGLAAVAASCGMALWFMPAVSTPFIAGPSPHWDLALRMSTAAMLAGPHVNRAVCVRACHPGRPAADNSLVDAAMTQLIFLLDTAYDRVSWHGPNLRGSLRGVTPREGAWRPAPGRHNIWELAVHAAYWKYAAWRRLTGAKRGSFPLAGSNFITRPNVHVEPSRSAGSGQAELQRAWRADLQLLDEMHRMLRAAVVALSAHDLDRPSAQPGITRRALLTGAAAHDLYHAGQIQLLKRLAGR